MLRVFVLFVGVVCVGLVFGDCVVGGGVFLLVVV